MSEIIWNWPRDYVDVIVYEDHLRGAENVVGGVVRTGAFMHAHVVSLPLLITAYVGIAFVTPL